MDYLIEKCDEIKRVIPTSLDPYSPPVHNPLFLMYFHAFSGWPPLHPYILLLQHELMYSPDNTLLIIAFEAMQRRSPNAEAVDMAYEYLVLTCDKIYREYANSTIIFANLLCIVDINNIKDNII